MPDRKWIPLLTGVQSCPGCAHHRQRQPDAVDAYVDAMLRREPPPWNPEMYGAMLRERYLRQQVVFRRVAAQEPPADE